MRPARGGALGAIAAALVLAGCAPDVSGAGESLKSFLDPLPGSSAEEYDQWMQNLTEWVPSARSAMGYSPDGPGVVFEAPELAWLDNSSMVASIMAFDRSLCSDAGTCANNYTTDLMLDALTEQAGAVDAVVMWVGGPFLGIDSRNQFQLMADMPGGLRSLSEIVSACHTDIEGASSRVLLGVIQGDTSTSPPNKDDDLCQALIATLTATQADGAYAPGSASMPQECSGSGGGRRFAVFADGPLGGAAPAGSAPALATHAGTRLRWTGGGAGFPEGSTSAAQPVPFASGRLLESRHLPLVGSEFDVPGRRVPVIHAGHLSGGMLWFGENVWGAASNPWTPLELALLARSAAILRYVSRTVRSAGPPRVLPPAEPAADPALAAAAAASAAALAAGASNPTAADAGVLPQWPVTSTPPGEASVTRVSGLCVATSSSVDALPGEGGGGGTNCTVWLLAQAGTHAAADVVVEVNVSGAGAGHRYFDLYAGRELKAQTSDADSVIVIMEPLGVGALLALPLPLGVALPPRLQQFMAFIRNETAAPLSEFANTANPVPQEWIRPGLAPPATSPPERMVLVPGVVGYNFSSTLLLPSAYFLPDAKAGGASERAGVGFQYPWSDEARLTTEAELDLPPFYMDLAPVTNKQYKAFCDATGHCARRARQERTLEGRLDPGTPEASAALAAHGPLAPLRRFLRHWNQTSADGQTLGFAAPLADAPVTWVGRSDALAYAAWAGKRLPTEWEWQRAAQAAAGGVGTDSRTFPWGSDPCTPGVQCQTPLTSRTANASDLSAVGAHPKGNSALGLVDMSGLVWQMTDAYCDVHTCATALKGGSAWAPDDPTNVLFPQSLAVNTVARLPMFGGEGFLSDFVGFRCVTDIPMRRSLEARD
ncbi:hypothetical protein FNF27_00886 [Cafeteria roenbergensis]|uniref:Sulfatase-modifying factor enzyme-like domain-containing protein n=1 Tax=Cafeteria roenbergensis TaxID=33653 RepID=A0A5A8DUV6_CAFRO|nr:hypothetical protein FNF28_03113 [Cafeteria roenbergensis]KAA0168444.1 hypothetical protein FNF31_00326 [Cafeteria roenbergensis]KAA0177714.1 hypothetical protein FNF27_00886 [Cafeteria roenbergensis]